MDKRIFSNEDKQRSVELDVLRAIAVLLVLGRHISIVPEFVPPGVRTFFLVWREVGWIGVDLFFVLSGFLVSGLLFREYQKNHRVSISRFLLRRGFKIYPPFYLLLAVTFAMSRFLPVPNDMRSYVGEIFFVQNYLGSVWNHTWSLAVEEHFYLLLSIIVYLLIRANKGALNPFKFLPSFFLFVAATLLFLRWIAGSQFPVGTWASTLVYSHLRIDSLLFGVLLAYLFHFHIGLLKLIAERFSFALILLAVSSVSVPLLFPLSDSRISYTFGFTILFLGFGALLILMLFSRSRAKEWLVRISAPFLVPIGRASYSIYLWHMFLYWMSVHFFLNAHSSVYLFSLQVSLYLIGSVLFGMWMFRMIEVPCLGMRDKFCSYLALERGNDSSATIRAKDGTANASRN